MTKRKLIYLLFIVLGVTIAKATGFIDGKIIDQNDKSPLSEAVIRLTMNRPDSAFVNGCTTDTAGYFRIDDVAPGKYMLKVEYIGYDAIRKAVNVAENANANLGTIELKSNTIMLKETTVVGVKTEIKVAEDTIEYNADSYKVQPNAVVEDLLKRLPGVEVGSDGKITSNGKEITKILLDGKEFFADDIKVASKNIPVEMIDKLQVVDRKSDLARMTGVDDGEDETVINLTVKKGMNQGWFGNATAGYGTNNRHEVNVMANYFRDGNQFTFLGGANNVNSMGFTDGGAQRFARFGGMNGINTTQNVGFNFNAGDKEEVFRAGGSVMYSHTNRDYIQKSNRQNLFADSTSYENSLAESLDKGHNIRGDFRLKWNPDSLNSFDFRPNFSINLSDAQKQSESEVLDAFQKAVNNSKSLNASEGKSYEFGGNLIYNHKVKSHPGRSFSVQARYNFSNIKENSATYTKNVFYRLSDQDQTIDEVFTNHRWNNNVNGRLSWTEPLGNVKNARFLNFSYRANFRWNNADKYAYDYVPPRENPTIHDLLHDENFRHLVSLNYGSYALENGFVLNEILQSEVNGIEFNPTLSNVFRNNFFNQEFRVAFQQTRKEYNLNAGLSLNSSMSSSKNLIDTEKTIPTRWTWNVAPFLRFRYKYSKTRNLAIDYRARTSEPSIAQLQPVADVTDPLRIIVGNPELKPTFTNSVNLRYSDFDAESQRSVMVMVNGSFATNSIISKTDFDSSTGGQITTYENVNGVWNAMAANMLSFPLRNKSFYFNSHVFLRYSNTKGYNNGLYNRSGNLSINLAPGMSFRTGVWDLSLRPTYGFTATFNSVQTNNNRTTHTYGGRFDGGYYAPFGLSIVTDLSYSASTGYSAGYNATQWLWNATASYSFLKDKSATIAVKVYDILGQKKNISRTVNANYILDSEVNGLTRYGMISFTYKFTTFKSKKDQPQMNNDFGPGGMRMGPPPGGGGGRGGGGGHPRF